MNTVEQISKYNIIVYLNVYVFTHDTSLPGVYNVGIQTLLPHFWCFIEPVIRCLGSSSPLPMPWKCWIGTMRLTSSKWFTSWRNENQSSSPVWYVYTSDLVHHNNNWHSQKTSTLKSIVVRNILSTYYLIILKIETHCVFWWAWSNAIFWKRFFLHGQIHMVDVRKLSHKHSNYSSRSSKRSWNLIIIITLTSISSEIIQGNGRFLPKGICL